MAEAKHRWIVGSEELGLLDTAEGRAVSARADEINAEGNAYQEELQRLRDFQRPVVTNQDSEEAS